jgi:hypothetical protein
MEPTTVIIDDDMTFPKATVNPKLLRLQNDVAEFVTNTILKHEKKFYELANELYAGDIDLKTELLGETNNKIVEMITMINNTYYNNLYFAIQRDIVETSNATTARKFISESEIQSIKSMATNGGYGAHVVLDKLVRLTTDTHFDILRENLTLDSLDIYMRSVLQEINSYLLQLNLLHMLSKGTNDSIEFCVVPDGKMPFDISAKLIGSK